MNQRSMTALIALTALFVIPVVASAATGNPGGYVSFYLGASSPQDSTVSITEFAPVSAKSARVQFSSGENIGGTCGYDFGHFRLEGEMSYKEGEISSVTESTLGTRYVNADGQVGALAMLVNGFYDLHNETPVTPYVGAGMGFASLSLSDTRGVDANAGAINNHIFREDSDNVLAFQAGAGVAVNLNRLLSVDVGYRYFATATASLRKDWPNSTDLKIASHNATVGVRVKF